MLKKAVFILALTLGTTGAYADSIVMDGETLTGVYIRSSTSMYYIQNPHDGSTLNVLKADVSAKAVKITRSRKERSAILAKWKRKNGIAEKPKTQAVHKPTEPILLDPPAAAQAAIRDTGQKNVEGEPKTRLTTFTNMPNKVARQKSGRKVFVDNNGTQIMTNDPSRFHGSEKYVEVILDYETIEIPKQFKAASLNRNTAKPFSDLGDIVKYYGRYYNLDINLIYAVITAESSGNPYAVSSVGARGLMQLMPGTAQEMGVKDIFDPVENVAGGTQYLSKLMKLYDGKSSLALAGYNAGPGNVRKYGGIPPFNETKDYIRRVLQYERQYKRHGAPTFDMAGAIPVDNGYLPPVSSKFYQLILENGLTVRAENITDSDTHYAYVFQGRSGRIRKDQVRNIYEPS